MTRFGGFDEFEGDDRVTWVHLTTVHGAFAADVITAHLAAEGVLFRIDGSASGPYRFNVGPMAAVSISVPAEDLEVARALIETDGGVLDLTDAVRRPPPPRVRADEDDFTDPDVYTRSERPDGRASGPRVPLRRRRAIS